MLRLSKRVEYALIALLYMAQKPAEELSSAREISERFSISLDILGKILQILSQGGILGSVRGVKGGYFLARSPSRVSLGEVIGLVEQPVSIVECLGGGGVEGCVCGPYCNIRLPMMWIQGRLEQFFGALTLEDMLVGVRLGGGDVECGCRTLEEVRDCPQRGRCVGEG